MCGILVSVNASLKEKVHALNENLNEEGVQLIGARGPDALKRFEYLLPGCNAHIQGVSSVLHLRGPKVIPQPLQSDQLCLQWNGQFNLNSNDTQFLFNQLQEGKHLFHVLTAINGPWAVCMLDLKEEVLYFGRDLLGRRSLLFKLEEGESCTVTSVTTDDGFVEAEASVLYALDLASWKLTRRTLPSRNWIINREISNNLSHIVPLAQRHLDSAIKNRIHSLPSPSDPIALLFSGGVDSLLLAVSCARLLPERTPIYLINVAFEHPGALKQMKLSTPDARYWSSIPDRQTGLLAFNELSKLFPRHKFTFIECNVSREEYDRSRPRVVQLMKPSKTVMDLSLAMVIWHGSQAVSLSNFENATSAQSFTIATVAIPPTIATTSTIATTHPLTTNRPKVIICGMGADEQLGGYSRHKNALSRDGYEGLAAELQLDLNRISTRNLGRDDRCISDAGLEGRMPFLDEEFVSFMCREVPLSAKISAEGEDKWLFRELLRRAGISGGLAGTPKKAMQFGAKSAKIERSQCQGDDELI